MTLMHDTTLPSSLLLLLLLLLCFDTEAGVCPPPGKIVPCSCTDLGSERLVVQLNCRSVNIDDARASQILDTMLSWPRASPLRLLDMFNNRLTRVPSQLPKFPMLNNIDLSYNQIASIKSNAFNFSSTLTSLNLNFNPISSIQKGAFQGYFGDSAVNLRSTSLSRFEAGVFQSMLEQIEPYHTTGRAYVDIYSNQINCSSDPCHMAWLILYNRQLLNVVWNSQCSNTGQSFSQIDRNSYFNCTFVCSMYENGNYSDPTSCTNYYNCNNGTHQLKTCPVVRNTTEQLMFDPLTKKCEKAAKTPGCSVRPFLCPTSDPYNNNYNANPNYANPNSPHSYYRCINDVPYLVDCGLLMFNGNSKQCDIITTAAAV